MAKIKKRDVLFKHCIENSIVVGKASLLARDNLSLSVIGEATPPLCWLFPGFFTQKTGTDDQKDTSASRLSQRDPWLSAPPSRVV